jgi:hypothetical protein
MACSGDCAVIVYRCCPDPDLRGIRDPSSAGGSAPGKESMKERSNPLELGCAYVRLQVLGACFPIQYGEDRWEHDESYI